LKKKNNKAQIVKWQIPAVPDEKAITKQTAPLVEVANLLVIKSEDHFVTAGVLIQDIDKAIMTVEEPFNPFVAGLHHLHKMAIKFRDGFVDPLYAAKDRLLILRKEYRDGQEEIKRKADAAAAKALQKAQQKELELQARAADRQGDKEVAAVLREQKEALPLPFMSTAPAVPKQDGFVIRERWVAFIDDPALVPREYCSPDLSLIRPVIERLGDKAAIPGVRAEPEKKEYSRGVA